MKIFNKQDHPSLQSFIWSDSSIQSYFFNHKEQSFELELIDYCENKVYVVFEGVESLLINDPVYIVNAKENKENGLFVLSLFDDDGEIIKVKYLNVKIKY